MMKIGRRRKKLFELKSRPVSGLDNACCSYSGLFIFTFFRYFVISRCVISLFRLFAWRYFVILRGVISWQKDEKTKWHQSATIVMYPFLFRVGALSRP